MTSRIGAKGQVVLPKALREQAEFAWHEDSIVLVARRDDRRLGGSFAQSGMASRLLEDRAGEPR